GLRALALERSAPLERLLRLAQQIHPIGPRASGSHARKRAQVVLPEGPRLGDVDIFLVTIDAMRADRLAPSTAPHLYALAQSGVTFARAYAQVPHTSFSLATLMTGTYVYSLSTLGLDAAHNETLAEVLRRERYKTAAFFPPAVFYIDGDRLRPFEQSSYGFEYVKYEYLPAPERTDQVIDFLKRENPPRAFVWVHYFEPHEPYELHPGFTQSKAGGAPTLLDRYDGEVRFVDAEVARLFDWERAHRRRALVVIAADHGEEFGEHGGHYHGTTLYEEQVRVPLVFALIGASDGPSLTARQVDGPVGLVDVMPTILSLVGIAPSARLRGRDLSPWMSPAGAPDRALGPIFSEIGRKKMVVDGLDKLICDLETESCQLFDLKTDPAERHNLTSDAGEREQLRGELDDWMTAQARFEKPQTVGDPRAQRILDRGRLGDRAALRELAGLLSSSPELAVRREAARLIVSLPADASTQGALEHAANESDAALSRWATVGLARLGDAQAESAIAEILDASCAPPGELCAEAALAVGDVPHLALSLAHFSGDHDLAVRLIAALGRSHSPDARDPLLIQLGEVRTRLETARALTTLGDPKILPAIERWIPYEPYLPVRAQLATLLGALGAGDPAARRTLEELAASEREPSVMRAIAGALVQLGSPLIEDPDRARARGRGELWLFGDGDGTLQISLGSSQVRVPMHDGVAHLETVRASAVRTAAVDGAPKVRQVLWRRVPRQRTEAASQSR
ncbi:MAG TPA: sulfatase-like hydrolase/transferase, partial [Polyangia bacterium]